MKERVLKHCLKHIEEVIADLTTNLDSIQESIEAEEKSSVGDKYETGRAMAQQEQERIRRQLSEAKRDFQILQHPLMSREHDNAQLGSLIQTDKRMIYLGPALGVITVEGKSIISTSMQSPLAQVFLDAEEGDVIEFRGSKEKVLKIE